MRLRGFFRAIRLPAAGSVVLLAVLAACKEEKKGGEAAQAPSPGASLASRVTEATEASLRANGVPQMRFRGIQVYTQAMPQRMAVCGQLDPFAEAPDLFVPFVSVVTLPANPASASTAYQFEHLVGTTTSEASHVYVAIVNYCYERGGPAAPPYHTVMSTPPMPDMIADPSPHNRLTVLTLGPAKPASSTDQAPGPGSVTMRQAGNLHSDPHGPTIRVIPQSTAMHVFSQAPGGWLQVGDTTPWGWVHDSLVDRH